MFAGRPRIPSFMLSILMIAACLAYLWIVYLGLVALRKDRVKAIPRSDRCDWSLFRPGLALLDPKKNNGLRMVLASELFGQKSAFKAKLNDIDHS